MTDFTGTPDGDTWFGSSGNDTAHGLGGDDRLFGNDGDDQLHGGADNDYLVGGAGDDLVDGGDGNDILALTDSNLFGPSELSAGDQFVGGSGIDTLALDGGFSTTYDLTAISIAADIEQITNEGNAARLTHAQLDQFSSIQGVFRLVGSGTLNLGGGRLGQSTSIYLDNGDDIVTMAGAGSPPGTNFGLHGGGGNDQLTGSEGIDGLEGGEGNDLLEGAGGDDFLTGGEGNDIMRGGAGDDQIFDGAGDDVIEGGADDDIVNLDLSGGFSAADQVSGGTGFDRLEITAIFLAPLDFSQFQIADDFEALRGHSARITISAERLSHFQSFEAAFVKLTTAGNFAISDTLKVADIELSDFGNGFDVSGGGGLTQYRVVGGADADTVTGSANNDLLTGRGGNDLIHAGQGSDTIGGGTGIDWIDGGGDDDVLRIEEGETASSGDRFTGGTGVDTLFIGGPIFASEVAVVDLSAATIDTDIERLEGDNMAGARLSIAQLANFSRVYLQAIHLTNGGAIDFSGKETRGYLYLSDASTTVTLSDMGFYEVIGGAGNDAVTGAADDDIIRGGGGGDVLSGGAGSDLLTGGAGHDVLTGGDGNDAYWVDGTDVIVEAAGGGGDMAFATSSYVLTAGAEVETMFASADAGAIDLTGNGFAQSISGNESANRLDGGGGVDTLVGHGGNDRLVVGYGDSAEGGSGTDTLVLSLAGATGVTLNTGALVGGPPFALGGGMIQGMEILESLEGSAFADTLTLAAQAQLLTVDAGGGDDLLSWGTSAVSVNGGAGNDRFINNVAADIIDGAAGSDTIDYRNATSGVTVTLALLAGQTGSGPGGDQLKNIEHIDGSGHGDTLNGSDGSNYLRGMAGNDTIKGKGGDDVLDGGEGVDMLDGDGGNDFFFARGGGDVLDGGTGIDTADYRQATGGVTVTLALLAGGTGSGPGGDQLRNIENVNGSFLGDTLSGNDDANFIEGLDGADTLAGNGGDDKLWGGFGEDKMTGGLGDDQFLVDDSDDQVFEATDEGDDVLTASISYVLAAGQHVERLVLLGGATATLSLTGNELANVLVGNEANNALNGGGGDDVLEGNAGQDAMAGGAGDDDYYVENAGDAVAELADEGDDAVYASVSYALAAGQSVELLAAASPGATTALNLTGNGLANSLIGNAGANQLNGGGGVDAMTGLGGNDTYLVDHAGDTAVEVAGGGTDIIYSAVSYSLNDGSEVESLSTITWEATTALNLTGNGLNNTLIGNAGRNLLNGAAGADTLFGREGNDVYFVDNAGDRPIEYAGQGVDVVYTSVSYTLAANTDVEGLATISFEATTALNLTGNGLANNMIGNDGANQLDGKSGADTMTGRAGNDKYLVDNALDRAFEAVGGGTDVVYSAVSFTLTDAQEIEGLSTITWELTNAINLTGNSLKNNLIGNAGVNVLDGRAGNDTLQGREGADSYAFTTVLGANNVDVILGFSSADDTIVLENNGVFVGLAGGALNANAFVIGTAAQDASDRIIYDQATGRLFFDADGNGAGAQIQFARLDAAPIIAASDFLVI